MKLYRTILALAVLSIGLALAQDDGGASRSVTYGASATAGSTIDGNVYVGEFGPNATIVVIAAQGTSAGAMHPAHFHAGDCGSGGGIEVPLSPVNGDTGLSVTLTDAPFERITTSDYHLNIHQSPEALDMIVACGEVGTGVQPVQESQPGGAAADRDAAADERAAGGADGDGDAAQDAGREDAAADDAAASETQAPSTASYGLFEVEGSGIRGQVQLTELIGDGTNFVITLVGVEEGQQHAAALYEGDCGPDRPKVIDLDPVGEAPEDPFSSVTETSLDFEEITSGDYFVYIFDSAQGEEIAACGEVGAGANR